MPAKAGLAIGWYLRARERSGIKREIHGVDLLAEEAAQEEKPKTEGGQE